jgi:hypothetical protein
MVCFREKRSCVGWAKRSVPNIGAWNVGHAALVGLRLGQARIFTVLPTAVCSLAHASGSMLSGFAWRAQKTVRYVRQRTEDI